MTQHVHRLVLATVLIAAGCSGQPVVEPNTATTDVTTTSILPQTAEVPDPSPPTTALVAVPERVGVTTTTSASPSTTSLSPNPTEVPLPETPVIAAIETGDLDTLVDELSAILGDLERSLTEEEGDVFND